MHGNAPYEHKNAPSAMLGAEEACWLANRYTIWVTWEKIPVAIAQKNPLAFRLAHELATQQADNS